MCVLKNVLFWFFSEFCVCDFPSPAEAVFSVIIIAILNKLFPRFYFKNSLFGIDLQNNHDSGNFWQKKTIIFFSKKTIIGRAQTRLWRRVIAPPSFNIDHLKVTSTREETIYSIQSRNDHPNKSCSNKDCTMLPATKAQQRQWTLLVIIFSK